MYKNVAKAGKKMKKTSKKGDAAKMDCVKDAVRRVKKEQIMDRGPMAQGENQTFK